MCLTSLTHRKGTNNLCASSREPVTPVGTETRRECDGGRGGGGFHGTHPPSISSSELHGRVQPVKVSQAVLHLQFCCTCVCIYMGILILTMFYFNKKPKAHWKPCVSVTYRFGMSCQGHHAGNGQESPNVTTWRHFFSCDRLHSQNHQSSRSGDSFSEITQNNPPSPLTLQMTWHYIQKTLKNPPKIKRTE